MPVDQILTIVQVIPNLKTGGAERLVLDIARQLQLRGHRVTIICFSSENGYTDLSEGLTIEIIPSQVLYSISGKNVINTEAFDKRIREIKPDTLHSHLLESEFVSRANPLKSTLYLTHWHGCHSPTNPRVFKDYFERGTWWNINSIYQLKKCYKSCNNQFLCISEFIKDYVKKSLSPKDNQLNVILNGTDLTNFKYEQTVKPKEQFTLIAIGSFHSYKNQIFLLQVMKKLKEQEVTDVHLQLLGDGAERQNLENYVADNNLAEMVSFLGYVDNPGHYLNRSNVLVHSAIDEPFGLILLEAMSCRIPIVAFRSGGIPEIVRDTETGYLTPVNNVNQFVEKLLRLKTTPGLADKMGKEGHSVVQNFGIEKYIKRLEILYFNLLKDQRA